MFNFLQNQIFYFPRGDSLGVPFGTCIIYCFFPPHASASLQRTVTHNRRPPDAHGFVGADNQVVGGLLLFLLFSCQKDIDKAGGCSVEQPYRVGNQSYAYYGAVCYFEKKTCERLTHRLLTHIGSG